MLVEKVDIAVVDALGDLLADLVRATAFDHVESCPAVLGLSTRRGTDEKVVLELALEVVLLNVFCEGNWKFPAQDLLASN